MFCVCWNFVSALVSNDQSLIKAYDTLTVQYGIFHRPFRGHWGSLFVLYTRQTERYGRREILKIDDNTTQLFRFREPNVRVFRERTIYRWACHRNHPSSFIMLIDPVVAFSIHPFRFSFFSGYLSISVPSTYKTSVKLRHLSELNSAPCRRISTI